MKLVAMTLALALTATVAMAREPKATQFGDVAKKAAVGMFGRAGDSVKIELADMSNEEESSTEVWEVTLGDGSANRGQATYRVTVKNSDSPNEDNGSIRMKLIDSN